MTLFDQVAAYQEANKSDKYLFIPSNSSVWNTFSGKVVGESYECHEYSNGKGDIGWRLISKKTVSGTKYYKCQNFGYESALSSDWQTAFN